MIKNFYYFKIIFLFYSFHFYKCDQNVLDPNNNNIIGVVIGNFSYIETIGEYCFNYTINKDYTENFGIGKLNDTEIYLYTIFLSRMNEYKLCTIIQDENITLTPIQIERNYYINEKTIKLLNSTHENVSIGNGLPSPNNVLAANIIMIIIFIIYFYSIIMLMTFSLCAPARYVF